MFPAPIQPASLVFICGLRQANTYVEVQLFDNRDICRIIAGCFVGSWNFPLDFFGTGAEYSLSVCVCFAMAKPFPAPYTPMRERHQVDKQSLLDVVSNKKVVLFSDKEVARRG
jgi:hypothetical protein|mmetsp:Transcript_72688/g.122380  ORF Transcript_72688/g.122380 Transcript_72688/m.122380 type:complete len:113 (-) Transcript_72688:1258-1596(-)